MTSVSRTLLDLAAILDPRRLEKAMAEAETRRLTSRIPVATLLERHPRRSGAATLRALIEADRTGITRSELEDRFLAFLDMRGLPRPRLNADLSLRGSFFEVDCLWDRERLVVELDGYAVDGTRQMFEGDRRRDRILQAEGWRALRVTWLNLRDEPEALAADLRGLLTS